MKELTEKYIAFFNDKDVDSIIGLLHDDAILIDPINRFVGKEEVTGEIKKIFESCKDLSFSAKNIFYDNERQTSIIEFVIDIYPAKDLQAIHLEGTDVIEWEGDKIKNLRAYLNLPNQ